MKKQNWSKAPEGATHWNGNLPYPWLRDNPLSLSFWVEVVGWREYPARVTGERHLFEAIPRPPKKQKKHERIAELLKGKTISGLTTRDANELCSYLGDGTSLIVDTLE